MLPRPTKSSRVPRTAIADCTPAQQLIKSLSRLSRSRKPHPVVTGWPSPDCRPSRVLNNLSLRLSGLFPVCSSTSFISRYPGGLLSRSTFPLSGSIPGSLLTRSVSLSLSGIIPVGFHTRFSLSLFRLSPGGLNARFPSFPPTLSVYPGTLWCWCRSLYGNCPHTQARNLRSYFRLPGLLRLRPRYIQQGPPPRRQSHSPTGLASRWTAATLTRYRLRRFSIAVRATTERLGFFPFFFFFSLRLHGSEGVLHDICVYVLFEISFRIVI